MELITEFAMNKLCIILNFSKKTSISYENFCFLYCLPDECKVFYHIYEKNIKTHPSIHCSRKHSTEVDDGLDKTLDL